MLVFRRLLPYALAVISVAVAASLRFALDVLWGNAIPFITFFLAIVFAAWNGGWGPGVFATVLAALVAGVLWLEPFAELSMIETPGVVALVVFVTSGVAISALSESLRNTRERAQRAAASARAAEAELRAQNQIKDEFLAMLGHELRNPLSAISSGVAVLDAMGEPDQRKQRVVDAIQRQSACLARMLDDLLDVSRVTTGSIVLHRQHVNLRALVESSLEAMQQTGRTQNHVIESDLTDVWVDGDPTRLDQIVSNLLVNAVKYTAAGGRIRVEVGIDDGLAKLIIEDWGAGIAADLLPRIFEPFVQSPRTLERAQGGLGVGLTMVRRLAHLHGGQVTAESKGEGVGSRFTVVLPRIAAIEHGADADPAPRSSQRRRVLLVEDQADTREMLRTLLVLQGHDVREAADGRSAVDAAIEWRPEVVLLDIGLPEFDGYEVVRRIRRAGIPSRVIAVTGYGQPADLRRSHEAGFDAHLVKPVNREGLERAIAG